MNDVKYNLDIGAAVAAMKKGNIVARKGWNGKNMHLFIVSGTYVTKTINDVYGSVDQTDRYALVQDSVYMFTAQGSVVPWLCSQSDLLAEDYGILPPTTI